MGFFLLIVTIWSLAYILGFIGNGIPAKIWRQWTRKQVFLTVLPLALIVVIELISPSTEFTGYTPSPASAQLQWHSQDSVWTDSPLTWADVNHHIFGADRNGYLPKETLRAQLKQRSSEVAAEYEASPYNDITNGNNEVVPIYLRLRQRRIHWVGLQLNSLNTALENLDTLYANGPVTPQKARLWQAEIVEDIARTEQTRAETAYETAKRNLANWRQANPETSKADPALAVLKYEESNTQRISQTSFQDMKQAHMQRSALAQQAEFVQPTQRFLTPPWPVEIATEGSNMRTLGLRSQTLKGPEITTGPLEWAARFFKAFDNRTRMPSKVLSGIRCYASITDQAGALLGNKTCEIHTPVLVNFDLTIADCVPAEGISCTERWVFPDLTILLNSSGITFLPLRPTAPAIHPASRWEITFNGETKPLKDAAFFTFSDGQFPRVSDYVLHQLPVDTTGKIRIWKDFETASYLRDEALLRNDPSFSMSHKFTGHSISAADLYRRIKYTIETVWPKTRAQTHRDGFLNRYLGVLARSYQSISKGQSGCYDYFDNLRIDTHSFLPKSVLYSRKLPVVSSWVEEPILPSERCRRANTLTVLYNGIWPTEPSKVFADNF